MSAKTIINGLLESPEYILGPVFKSKPSAKKQVTIVDGALTINQNRVDTLFIHFSVKLKNGKIQAVSNSIDVSSEAEEELVKKLNDQRSLFSEICKSKLTKSDFKKQVEDLVSEDPELANWVAAYLLPKIDAMVEWAEANDFDQVSSDREDLENGFQSDIDRLVKTIKVPYDIRPILNKFRFSQQSHSGDMRALATLLVKAKQPGDTAFKVIYQAVDRRGTIDDRICFILLNKEEEVEFKLGLKRLAKDDVIKRLSVR